MNQLTSRKQLLIAESELNRAQLVREWQAITTDVHALSNQVKTIGSLASVAASVFSVFGWLRSPKPAPAAGKSSWWQTIFKGAELAGSLWSEFRTPKK